MTVNWVCNLPCDIEWTSVINKPNICQGQEGRTEGDFVK